VLLAAAVVLFVGHLGREGRKEGREGGRVSEEEEEEEEEKEEEGGREGGGEGLTSTMLATWSIPSRLALFLSACTAFSARRRS
jgi:hypothetical protein